MRIEVPVPGGEPIALDDGVLTAPAAEAAPLPRRCYAAAHVVMLPSYGSVAHSVERPGAAAEIAEHIDWDATMALRTRIDGYGMGVAEAMDTAQRFELGWESARELLRRTGELGLVNGFVGAASTDHAGELDTLEAVADAVIEQIEEVRSRGGLAIVLPQLWMTRRGASEDDHVRLYRRIAEGAGGELLIHWLGESFHPGMRGYFPGESARRVLAAHPEVWRGIKLSLLDRAFEEELRAELLPRGQVVLTGDDYNFSGLIEGSGGGQPLTPLDGRPLAGGPFSHALLGIFDAVVRPASAALARLGQGDAGGYREIMAPCEDLGRTIFEAPVPRYKAGIAFLSWLNGHQPNPMLVNHEERERSLGHYLRVAALASRAGVIEDAQLAAERLGGFIRAHGTVD